MSEDNQAPNTENAQQEVPLPIPKASWMWLKDSNGYPSISVTIATVAFWTTTLTFLASCFQKIGPVELRPFDAAAASGYLVPCLSLYFARRWTDAKFGVTK